MRDPEPKPEGDEQPQDGGESSEPESPPSE